MDLIEAKSLSKSFGDKKVLDSMSFSVPKGELFGFLGPNGAGKTTTIRILTGQIKPTSGTANVMGIDVTKDPVKARSLIGIVPEQETPPSFLTAVEYLQFVARIRNLSNLDCIPWWLKFLEFEDSKNILCKDLSRGTRQKLMVAQAFLHDPELVLIDEPLINFDPIMQKKLKDYLTAYVKKGGTVFISTHILEIAEEICTKVMIISKGKVKEISMKELRHRKESLEEFFLKTVNA